jgi:hypothetical protein
MTKPPKFERLDEKPKRGFGARLALIAMAAFFAAFAWVFFYYIGF